jgi:hypothetical protein
MQFGFPILLLIGALLGVVAVVGLAAGGARVTWGGLIIGAFALLLAAASESVAFVWWRSVVRFQPHRHSGTDT